MEIKRTTPLCARSPLRSSRENRRGAASALNHTNIITIYDIDQADGALFIVMEFVSGKTLDQLIPRKGLRLNEALKYAIQIADALAATHAAGIVHRDLKMDVGWRRLVGDPADHFRDFGHR